MGFTARRGTNEVLPALVTAHNNTRRAAAVLEAYFHADVTSDTGGSINAPTVAAAAVSAANASDLATSLVLVNQIRQRWLQHRADDLAHKVSDGLPALTAPVATDLTTAQTLANELKADYNVHIASATYHYTVDAANAIAAPDASNQGTLNTLLNELKTDFNLHIASAPVGQSVKLIDP